MVQGDDGKVANAPRKSCGGYTTPRGCCYDGKYIGEGKTLRISACKWCTCKSGHRICQVMDCAIPPKGCRYIQTATECCKLVCDKGCTYNGIFIPEGQSKTVAPCQYGYCNGGKVALAIADCAPPPPGCRYESTMEECCKMICDKGCNYNGILIPEGESKVVAPCQYGYCNGGKVAIAIMDCARPPLNCNYEPTLENCCNLICNGPPIDELSVETAPKV